MQGQSKICPCGQVKEMTGNQLEKYVTRKLFECGWWALRIPRNPNGAQPFDIIAVKGSNVLAVDCKACAEPKFPIKRVEANQWTAFDTMLMRTNAVVGIVAENNETLYLIEYPELINCGKSYIALNDNHIKRFVDVCHCKRRYSDI